MKHIEANQAVERQMNTPSLNGAYSEENSFEITLSVSDEQVRARGKAEIVTSFNQYTFYSDVDSDTLNQLFRTNLYSTHIWSGGCHGDNYIGMTGVSLDIDGGMTIAEAQDTFAEFNYILHTSSSHQIEKDGVTCDRYRVILPFVPSGLYFPQKLDAKKVYRKLLDQYPLADQACKDLARKYFPSLEESEAPYFFDIHATGKYYQIDISDVPDEAVSDKRKPYKWDGKLLPKSGLQKVLKHCPFIRWMKEHIDDRTIKIREPLKYALITNLARFEGGREIIHEILKRDWRKHKYDPDTVDAKIKNALRNGGPQRYSTIVSLGWESVCPDWPASPAGWAYYVDFEGVLSHLKSLNGKKQMDVLEEHLAGDFQLLSTGRQITWLTQLSQDLRIPMTTLSSMACDATAESDLASRDLSDIIKGVDALGGAPESAGRIIYRWFTENGGLVYRDREHLGYWIWEGTVYDVDKNQPFKSLIYRIAGITSPGTENSKIWDVLSAETDINGVLLKSFTWLHTDVANNRIHVNLNLEEDQVVRIDTNGAQLVDNGANDDSILLAPSSKMEPIQLESIGAKDYRSILKEFDSLVLKNLATGRNNQLLVGCWSMTYPLIDFVKTLPHLRCEGVSTSGKSKGMELISQFIYGADRLKTSTTAANYTDGAKNPLIFLDNIEVVNFNQGLGDFILTAVTGITKEKRVLGTNRDTVLEKVHCLVATNGIENLGKTEHINRTLSVKFDRWKHASKGWSERIYGQIAAIRPRLASAHMLLVSKVLKRIADGGLENWLDYLHEKHPGHAKDRFNSFIALMALILEELLPTIDPEKSAKQVVSAWIKSQNMQGQRTAIESNPIVDLLEAILEDSERNGVLISSDLFSQWGYEVKVEKRTVIGTASQLHHTFAAAARRKGLKYEFKNARQLSTRIADTAKTLAVETTDDVVFTEWFSLTKEKDRTKTTVYTFDFSAGKPRGDEDAGDE